MQDVVVDTVGDTTVGPVAEDVKDTSTGLADGTLAGGLFNGITPQNGMKLTTLTITLPVGSEHYLSCGPSDQQCPDHLRHRGR